MFCSVCRNQFSEGESFCRRCGATLVAQLSAPLKPESPPKTGFWKLTGSGSKDPDELTGNGIGSVIVGDGFLMVAVMLSVTSTAISSLLWLLLLIPAFFFFGRGFADVLHARQIQQRRKQAEIESKRTNGELLPANTSIFVPHSSSELVAPSVTERTTRELE